MSQFTLPRLVEDGRQTEPARLNPTTPTAQKSGPPRPQSGQRNQANKRFEAVAPPSARDRRPAPRHLQTPPWPEDSNSFEVVNDQDVVVDRSAYCAHDAPDDPNLHDIISVIGDMAIHVIHAGSNPYIVSKQGSPNRNMDSKKIFDIPMGTKAILLCCYVDDLAPVAQLVRHIKRWRGCPPIIALILRPSGVPFATHLVGAASEKLAQLRVDNVLVQPRNKLDIPDLLQTAFVMIRARQDTENRLNEQIDERANSLFFNNIDLIIKGFPKLNTDMEERIPAKGCPGGIGRHNFAQRLGEGKFGTVYKIDANPHETQQTEAVKVISKRCIRTAKHANQILKECRLLQKVRHPNIAEFRGLVHARLKLYIFMEYVGTQDLSVVISMGQNGRLESAEVLELFLQITDAVAFCHQSALAHRDIKSENIVLNEERVPKLVDFGLATEMKDADGLCEDKCGTIPFAPPEVYRGKKFKATAMDVWSLGILTLEMRCGNNGVTKMLGIFDNAEPNDELAEKVEVFFGNPDWPLVTQRCFPGVGMAQELLLVLRGCLVVQPDFRWHASDLYNHIANSSSNDRVTGRISEATVEYADRVTDVAYNAVSFNDRVDDFRDLEFNEWPTSNSMAVKKFR